MTKLTEAKAKFISTAINRAFPDAMARAYVPKLAPKGEYSVEYLETPEGASFPHEKYITHEEDFGFCFKELCAKRAYYALMGRTN